MGAVISHTAAFTAGADRGEWISYHTQAMPSSASPSSQFITAVKALTCFIITVSPSAATVSTQGGFENFGKLHFYAALALLPFICLSLFLNMDVFLYTSPLSISPPSARPTSSHFHCGLIRHIYFTAWLPVCANGTKFFTPEATRGPSVSLKQDCWGQRAVEEDFLHLFLVRYPSRAMLSSSFHSQQFWGRSN